MPDFAEFIHFEANVKTHVKVDYVNYVLQLHSQTQQSAKTTTFGVDSAFNNDDVSKAIQLIINATPNLQDLVGVCPVFVEYAIIQPTLAAFNQSQKSCQTALRDIDAKYSMNCFLEGIWENAVLLLNKSIIQCEYLIIPFLIREHFSIGVIKLEKNIKKSATIYYYDSYGHDLMREYKQQLITFLAHEGFETRYACLSKYQQKDNYNCGVFAILKAIDILNEQHGSNMRFLDNLQVNKHDYNKIFNDYRHQIGALLKENGSKIKISASLRKTIEDYEKICF